MTRTRLLPTVRSRCARIRLGPVGPRDIEAILADRGAADPPTAARLGRMVGGRPGIALAYAYAPDALRVRSELARILLDLLDAAPAERLAAMRAAMPQALVWRPTSSVARASQVPPGRRDRRERRRRGGRTADDLAGPRARPRRSGRPRRPSPHPTGLTTPTLIRSIPTRRRARCRPRFGDARRRPWCSSGPRSRAIWPSWRPAERRRSTTRRCSRRPTTAAAGLAPDATVDALRRLERAGTHIAANVSPELVLDALAVGWPRRRAVSAA